MVKRPLKDAPDLQDRVGVRRDQQMGPSRPFVTGLAMAPFHYPMIPRMDVAGQCVQMWCGGKSLGAHSTGPCDSWEGGEAAKASIPVRISPLRFAYDHHARRHYPGRGGWTDTVSIPGRHASPLLDPTSKRSRPFSCYQCARRLHPRYRCKRSAFLLRGPCRTGRFPAACPSSERRQSRRPLTAVP